MFCYSCFQRQYADVQAIAARSNVTTVTINDDDEGI